MLVGQIFNEANVIIFGLIWLRMLSFVMSSAFFSSPSVSLPIKILFSIVMTFVVAPIAEFSTADTNAITSGLVMYAFKEVSIGLFLGFLTRFFFFALSMAGEMISISLGLSSAQVYNPFSGQNGQVVEQFFSLFGMMVFLSLNGHHVFVTALVESFQVIPLAKSGIEFGGLAEVASRFQSIFVIVVKMSAPIVLTLFIVNIAMSIIGRAVPQMNVLVTSFPVTIMIGLVVMIISIPLMSYEMNLLIESTSSELFKMMRTL